MVSIYLNWLPQFEIDCKIGLVKKLSLELQGHTLDSPNKILFDYGIREGISVDAVYLVDSRIQFEHVCLPLGYSRD
jgi:hypothetical protein